jgi:sugar lactone lactonase YvrE
MLKRSRLFSLNVVILILLSVSMMACRGSTPVITPQPPSPTGVSFAGGPKGLPLYCPLGIVLDSQGNIYVSDNDAVHNSRVRLIKLSPSGQFLAEWDPFKLTSLAGNPGPFDLAVDQQGIMYVSDGSDDTIKKIAADGSVLASWGGTGSAPGQLTWPIGVALDAQGNVYVVDYENSRIQKFSPTGKLLAVLGNTGPTVQQLNHPGWVAVDAQGNVYVSDHGKNRIVKYSSTGKFLAAWNTFGSAIGQIMDIEGITIDAQGNIYVGANQHIIKLSSTGEVLATWDISPLSIVGLAVDRQGNVYATEGSPTSGGVPADRLEKLSPTGKALATWKALCTGE